MTLYPNLFVEAQYWEGDPHRERHLRITIGRVEIGFRAAPATT